LLDGNSVARESMELGALGRCGFLSREAIEMKATWFVMSVVGYLALEYSAGSEPEEITLAKGGRLLIPGEGGAKVVVGFLDDSAREPGVWIYDHGETLRGEMVVVVGRRQGAGTPLWECEMTVARGLRPSPSTTRVATVQTRDSLYSEPRLELRLPSSEPASASTVV
jgi:hypothetical protein